MPRGSLFAAVLTLSRGMGEAALAQQSAQKGGKLGDALSRLRQQALQKRLAAEKDKSAKKDYVASKDRKNLKLVNPGTFGPPITVEKLNAELTGELAALGQ